MKQIKTLLIAAIALISVQTANAQTKIAHVDTNEIMSKMPAVLDGQNQLKKLGEAYDKDYKALVDEYQAKVKKYDAEAATQTDAVNQTRQVEVQDMIKRINEFEKTAQADLQKKEVEIMKPITEKVRASIEKVGKAKGFQYVLNAESLLLKDGTDITPDVKKDLGF
ncbi:OmpH family outer membrane protein [Flavobacterium sp.]|uniref:OmpH family outer membrane protein n=1 Tax=Flavobacterium sp. TaxID=239 RepID=UPI00262FB0DB|nr:OmpH family outer membrane protein [Flavobacterium sp.]